MAHKRHPALKRTSSGEPEIVQGIIYGLFVTWNPDDDRYYACKADDETIVHGIFKDWRNLIQFCYRHKA